jgi:hypothetical protein
MYLEQYAMLCRQIEQLMELVAGLVEQILGATHMMSIPSVGLTRVGTAASCISSTTVLSTTAACSIN